MATAKREMTFLLAKPERRLLRAIAARLPRQINSDHLTGIGVLGAVGAGAAYALSAHHIAWLWAASGMLALNWFGDSLDGTLARVRHTERPKYGYYVDHVVDALATAAVGTGIGLSPFVSLPLALVLVVLFLTLAINVYLESNVFGVFKIGYGPIGPTEARAILILGNTALLLSALVSDPPMQLVTVAGNLVASVLSVGMLTALLVRFGKNLRRLSHMEPLPEV